MQPSLSERLVYSVSSLNTEIRDLLEHQYQQIWVEGEISNLARPASGHIYFSLKDATGQVRCAMFRGSRRGLRFAPDNGMQITVQARASLYPARGEFQLIVQHMEAAGDGALLQAFEALKQRLAAEGLFDTAHKRPLPRVPARVAIITSPSGAAVHDILTVLQRRFPALPVHIYPVPVQGAEAPAAIIQALRQAGERNDSDVLILARGGGSLEDLWAFNDEGVARAIHACPIPIVSGVGHEVDFTIADFSADLRAATPSAAAETISPDQEEWRHRLRSNRQRLSQAWHHRLDKQRQRLQAARHRLRHPRQRLDDRSQQLDGLRQRLLSTQRAMHHGHRVRLERLLGRLGQQHPGNRLSGMRRQVGVLEDKLASSWQRVAQHKASQLEVLNRALLAISPQATLERGYSILVRREDGAIVRDSNAVKPGDRLRARLAHGDLDCLVGPSPDTSPDTTT